MTESLTPAEPSFALRCLPGTSTACADALLRELRAHANPDNAAGMARYGIRGSDVLGVSMPTVRRLATEAKRSLGRGNITERHAAADRLWRSGVHEARIMAALIDAPELVTATQMEEWVARIDSWDVCDQLMGNLFDKTPLAWEKAAEWAGRDEEFVKRAGFVLMTQLAVHDKQASDSDLAAFLPLIEREARDVRNFVKKAVNWALRQIGKRSPELHAAAVESAERIAASAGSLEPGQARAARWVAADALRELRSDAVRERLGLG